MTMVILFSCFEFFFFIDTFDWEPELILPLHKTIYKNMNIKNFSQLRYLPCIDWSESIRFNKVVISLRDVLPLLPLAAVTLAYKRYKKVSFGLIFTFSSIFA